MADNILEANRLYGKAAANSFEEPDIPHVELPKIDKDIVREIERSKVEAVEKLASGLHRIAYNQECNRIVEQIEKELKRKKNVYALIAFKDGDLYIKTYAEFMNFYYDNVCSYYDREIKRLKDFRSAVKSGINEYMTPWDSLRDRDHDDKLASFFGLNYEQESNLKRIEDGHDLVPPRYEGLYRINVEVNKTQKFRIYRESNISDVYESIQKHESVEISDHKIEDSKHYVTFELFDVQVDSKVPVKDFNIKGNNPFGF